MLIETVLATREKTHGVYAEQAALAQLLKRLLRGTRNWEKLDDCQAQSMEALCDKISRILNGNNNEIDHWQDVSGYSSLVVRELEMRVGGSANPEVPNAKLPVSIKRQDGDGPLNVPSFLVQQMEDDMRDAFKK
jgi:hypothetical protein